MLFYTRPCELFIVHLVLKQTAQVLAFYFSTKQENSM